MKKQLINGLWRFADNDWVGTLRLTSGKSPKLKLTIPKRDGFSTEEFPEVLHGCNKNGQPITLLFPARISVRSSGVISRVEYSAGYALVGTHIENSNSFCAHKVEIKIPCLYDWIGESGFQESSRNGFENTIHHILPESQCFEVSADLKIKIVWSTQSKWSRKQKSLNEDVFVQLISNDGLTFQEYQALTKAICQLLHFATLEKIFPSGIRCNGRPDPISSEVSTGKPFDVHSAWNRVVAAPRSGMNDRWVFTFEDVKSDFGDFIARWIDFQKKYHEALDCYFSTIYHRLPDVVRLLCLTQSLDAYHGIKHQSHKEQDFEGKIREITEAHQAKFQNFFGDPAEFAKSVAHNRNYYTHHNPKWLAQGRVVEGVQLFRLTEKLRHLFQACILSEIGIPDNRASRLNWQIATHVIEYS